MFKVLAAATALGTMMSAAVAQENGPITQVTLSSGGLAEIVRTARVTGSGLVEVDIPTAQIDDVLKSLLVRDPSGKVGKVSLDGPAQDDLARRALPFPAGELTSVPSLLSALQGSRMTISSGGKTLTGLVMGVETRSMGENETLALLTVVSDDGAIDTLKLGPDARLTIEDPSVRRKVDASIKAAGARASDGSRLVRIAVEGSGERDVTLSYVVEASVWKAAYRIVADQDGKARMQAWAILENASGEDWNGIHLSLSSGKPVTLKQALHRRYWADRTEVPVSVGSAPLPATDTGVLAMESADHEPSRMRASAMLAAPAPAAEPAPLLSQAVSAEASEGDLSARYFLPGTYDLQSGQSLSVPLVDADLQASLVSVYRSGQASSHPIASVSLTNATGASLPPGIVTVYDERSGYLGDAQLGGVPPLESRLAGFAADSKVQVVEEAEDETSIIDVKAVDGLLKATFRNRQSVTYRIAGAADAPRTVVIEHPRMAGWTFASDAADGETATHHRLKASISPSSSATVKAMQEMIREEAYALVDADAQQLVSLAGSARDPETRRKIEELADARRRQSEAQRAIDDATRDIDERSQAQARIRDNLGAVPDNSDLQKSYLQRLSKAEDAISALEAKRGEACEAEAEASKLVGEAIRSFTSD
ncbi:DUF4139 domain-containing protein [Tianweitania populi]|uniref:DUF4139 domain-containing protein n=1 Tax=Tianweitania populi TaxID=1607949 RepID=A0A8J3DS64_9HYPH|nr:DUF4139 domain-containing protein [Tianweitania populi]GHD21019.1 hypothetical protein GCM10016234_34240 [Tianweitania populi]